MHECDLNSIDNMHVDCAMYYPIVASLITKKKGNKLYYYVVDSARVEGKPRIVQQTYLGTAERLAELLKERTAPVPLSATTREFGLPGALWLAAQSSGVWDVLKAMWPDPRSGPSQSRITCCWTSSIVSASRDPRRRLRIGTGPRSCNRYGLFRPNGFVPRISGTPLTRSTLKMINVAERMNWKRRNYGC